jgi:alkanesulfonate monooxygenase SsuD/methylene tetrahydromethanopterin reductase-like flavin-dependent oxidoreductase (luciferase family)
MKVGLVLNNQLPLSTDMVSAFLEQIAMVRLVRDHGWDSVLASMHYLPEGNVQQLQQVPLLARLAAEAGDLTLGVAIFLLNLHNPVYTAETMASLDVICRGNFIMGLGLGYRDMEFDAFAVPKGTRVRRFEEGLALIKRLWTEDEVTFENDVCKLTKVRMNLRPVQKPHPPIWMAANADVAVVRAARLGDCWYINPHATLETNLRQMGLYLAERKRLALPAPTEVPCRREIFCAKDRRTALEMVGPFLSEKYKLYSNWGQAKAMPSNERLDQAFDELTRDRFILGSPEDCYEQLRPYWERLGVTHFVFRTHFIGMPISSALHNMRMISTELLPELRRAQPRATAAVA